MLLSLDRVLAGRRPADGVTRAASVQAVWRRVLANPVLWAIAIGSLFSARAVPLPDLVQRPVGIVGTAVGPAATSLTVATALACITQPLLARLPLGTAPAAA